MAGGRNRLGRRRVLQTLLATPALLLSTSCGGPSLLTGRTLAPQPGGVHSVRKIGIGAWEASHFSMLHWIEQMGFGWYYNWRMDHLYEQRPTYRSVPFVPMVWGRRDLYARPPSGARHLLGFNEPDGPDISHQANIPVEEAVALWPRLMAHRLRLGSPATTAGQTLGRDSWQARFMERAEDLGHRVDFMAVHYYSTDASVPRFRDWLEAVQARYRRPVWVTEWALIDWSRPTAVPMGQAARFAQDALEMLSRLPFVERHAWFAANPHRSGAQINLVDGNGHLTELGAVFRAALAAETLAGADGTDSAATDH